MKTFNELLFTENDIVPINESVIRFKVSDVKKHKNKVTSDNIKTFDNLVKSNGVLMTLDARPYIDFLTDINVFYTVKNS